MAGAWGYCATATAPVSVPKDYQADVEGAAYIRQDLTQNSDVDGYDFRIGFPVTYGWDRWLFKVAWYHTSSHLGDEFELKHPTIPRINYSRNAIVWGLSYYLTDDIRVVRRSGLRLL